MLRPNCETDQHLGGHEFIFGEDRKDWYEYALSYREQKCRRVIPSVSAKQSRICVADRNAIALSADSKVGCSRSSRSQRMHRGLGVIAVRQS